MKIGNFIILIASLYLLETSFIPGVFTGDSMLHISLLLFLAFIYQSWNNWIAGFFVFTLLMPFAFGEARIPLLFTYAGLIGVSYLLTQSVLGTRSFSSYLVYTTIIATILSALHVLIFKLGPQVFINHWIFSCTFLILARSAFPIRAKVSLSSL